MNSDTGPGHGNWASQEMPAIPIVVRIVTSVCNASPREPPGQGTSSRPAWLPESRGTNRQWASQAPEGLLKHRLARPVPRVSVSWAGRGLRFAFGTGSQVMLRCHETRPENGCLRGCRTACAAVDLSSQLSVTSETFWGFVLGHACQPLSSTVLGLGQVCSLFMPGNRYQSHLNLKIFYSCSVGVAQWLKVDL